MTVLLQSAASNDYAASRVRELFAAQVLPAFARVGSRADAAERAGLVASQLLGLALCRYMSTSYYANPSATAHSATGSPDG